MTVAAIDYTPYFREEQQTNICIKLANNKLLEVNGLVVFIEGDQLTLELVGTEPADAMSAESGSEVSIMHWTGWSLCRFTALLLQKIIGREVLLRLTGQVIEKQTREYFRLDVSIPVSYSIPEKQILSSVHEEWVAARGLLNEHAAPLLVACPGGFKAIKWNGQGEIAPSMVNLSGAGFRFKTPEYVEPESMVFINLFLPLIPPRVIQIVAETLRCSEIVLGREKGHNYITATRFHFINEKDREAIIGFIFAEQRRLLIAQTEKRI
jgi:hypothetical protein